MTKRTTKNSNKKKSDTSNSSKNKKSNDKKSNDTVPKPDNEQKNNKRQKLDKPEKPEEPQESDKSDNDHKESDDLNDLDDSDNSDIILDDTDNSDIFDNPDDPEDPDDILDDPDDPEDPDDIFDTIFDDIEEPITADELKHDQKTIQNIIMSAYTFGILDTIQDSGGGCNTCCSVPPQEGQKGQESKKVINIKDFRLNKDIKECKSIIDLINLLDHKKAIQNQQDLRNALIELNNLVGLSKLKEQVVNQILFFLQDLNEPGTFLHTVITGSPGTGKTTLINIMAKIYKSLGILQKGHVVKADRSDLIAEYLGQTAIKTKKVLDSAKGGIILIDEAYSLGSDSKNTDSFSKECIDTINQYLSEHVDELVCIICGYEKEIEKCFFKKNSGLARRFQWRFNIDSYSAKDLCDIFMSQFTSLQKSVGPPSPTNSIGASGASWTLGDTLTQEYITKKIDENMKYFSGNGGSTRSLIDKCKVIYAQRNFNNDSVKKLKKQKMTEKVLTLEDFDRGLETYLESMNKNNKDQLCSHCSERDVLVQEENNCSHCKERKKNYTSSMYS